MSSLFFLSFFSRSRSKSENLKTQPRTSFLTSTASKMILPNVLKIASNQHMYFFYNFLAVTELPCETDGFAGNYDDYPSTPCKQGKRCFQKGCMNTFQKTINMRYKSMVGIKFDLNLSSRHVWEGS